MQSNTHCCRALQVRSCSWKVLKPLMLQLIVLRCQLPADFETSTQQEVPKVANSCLRSMCSTHNSSSLVRPKLMLCKQVSPAHTLQASIKPSTLQSSMPPTTASQWLQHVLLCQWPAVNHQGMPASQLPLSSTLAVTWLCRTIMGTVHTTA